MLARWVSLSLLVLLGCVLTAACASASRVTGSQAAARPPAPQLIFDESYPPDLELCVLTMPFIRTKYPIACLTLGALRAQLRARQQVAIPPLTEGPSPGR